MGLCPDNVCEYLVSNLVSTVSWFSSFKLYHFLLIATL